MRRAAWIFLAAIFLPCLVLAWLAIRSEQDQQVILQHQQAIIDQGVADSLAQNVRTQMDAVLADFVRTTQQLLATAGSPEGLAAGFHQKIHEAWPLAQVGFAVGLQGVIYAPERSDGVPAQTFRKLNESFLSNQEDAEVYSNVQSQLQNFAPHANVIANSTRVVQSSSSSNSITPMGRNLNNSFFVPKVTTPVTATASPSSSTISAPDLPGNAKLAFSTSPPAALAPAATDSLRSSLAKNEQPLAKTAAATPPPAQPSVIAAPAEASQKLSDELKSIKKNVGGASSDLSLSSRQPAVVPPVTSSTGSVAQDKQVSADSSASLSQAMTTASEAPLAPATQPFIQTQSQIARIERQVSPRENTSAPDAALSNVVPAQSDFRQLIGQSTSGSVARFLEDKLCLLVWSLPSAQASIVFGAQLNQDKLVDKLRTLVQPDANRSNLDSSFGSHADYCLALLDDKGHPVALSKAGFITDWKHPFVATEIGSVLPHWEAVLYLIDPAQVSHSARVLHFTIGLIILLLIVAIVAGGSLIGADVNRQMRLAQQKTDFVSNVSHELKTPLTSIRMFADMLAEGRIEDQDKQATYLRIISAESARLTRLINNVLDFARMERGVPARERHLCDLVEAAHDVVESCQPHLESAAVTLAFEIEAESLPLVGNRDALSQIILNLISNAEKYGGGEIVVRVRRQDTPAGPMGCVDVLDRGPGIPTKQVESVFSPFRRLNDSLASGVPGSGLGLTLARRMARAHGGDVTYQARAGGGSCFTLTLPLSKKS